MRFVHVMPLAALLGASLAIPAQAFTLITEDEARQDRLAVEPTRSRSLPHPSAPRIELLAPVIGKPLSSPMDIRLRWTAAEGSSIDIATVRVRYGRLGIDVTERVLGAAKITQAGIDAPAAKLPAGEHRLAVEVSDSQRRVARQEFVVQIQQSL